MHVRVCERLGDPGRGEAGAGACAEGRGTDVDAGEQWAGSARPAEAATARGRRAGRLTPRKRSRRVPGSHVCHVGKSHRQSHWQR